MGVEQVDQDEDGILANTTWTTCNKIINVSLNSPISDWLIDWTSPITDGSAAIAGNLFARLAEPHKSCFNLCSPELSAAHHHHHQQQQQSNRPPSTLFPKLCAHRCYHYNLQYLQMYLHDNICSALVLHDQIYYTPVPFKIPLQQRSSSYSLSSKKWVQPDLVVPWH